VTRSFCYVSALVDGLRKLMQRDVQAPVNIGNPDERTILDLAKLVIELADSESDITYEPLPPQDPQVRKPDITKARSELDWEPDVPLREGLQRSIAYFEERI
jgi:dTDP-glucose 4,6-dehydratase